jgi:hypothetical protein
MMGQTETPDSSLTGRAPILILAGYPPGVRALYVTWEVEAEVNNGGFHQYYWNTGDRYSEQAVDGFEFFER